MPTLSQGLSAYFGGTGARILRLAVLAILGLLIFFTIRAGVEKWQRAKYEKVVRAMEQQIRDAEAKAKDAEARAEVIGRLIDNKSAEIQFLEARAKVAEANLQNTRRAVMPLKKVYEEIRDTPMPTVDVPCADACRDLAAAGHPCR